MGKSSIPDQIVIGVNVTSPSRDWTHAAGHYQNQDFLPSDAVLRFQLLEDKGGKEHRYSLRVLEGGEGNCNSEHKRKII